MNLYTLIDPSWLVRAKEEFDQSKPLNNILKNVPLINHTTKEHIDKITFYKSLLCNRLITIKQFYEHTTKAETFKSLYIRHHSILIECITIIQRRDEDLLDQYLQDLVPGHDRSQIISPPISFTNLLTNRSSTQSTDQQQSATPLHAAPQRPQQSATPLHAAPQRQPQQSATPLHAAPQRQPQQSATPLHAAPQRQPQRLPHQDVAPLHSAQLNPPPHPKLGRPKRSVPPTLKQTILALFEQHGRHGVSQTYELLTADIAYAQSHLIDFQNMKSGNIPHPTPTQQWFENINRAHQLNNITNYIPCELNPDDPPVSYPQQLLNIQYLPDPLPQMPSHHMVQRVFEELGKMERRGPRKPKGRTRYVACLPNQIWHVDIHFLHGNRNEILYAAI
ncbi:hypothetical protein TVAGG3_0132410, partial [Trichomonas vaginalis G3]|uniref:hypothetical protein n=1 Tax=Trichomonas vaginalis (strain ATCC PRA-98 / G3) TaxID=412133 RepID=UPI0021E572B3